MKLAIRMTLTLCLLAAGLCAQTTYYVDQANPNCPGDGSQGNPFCTIQQGINAAAPGDTVLVLPGTYVQNLILGKKLTLKGQAGAASTIVDGNQLGSVVTINSVGAGPGLVLEGLTFANGQAPSDKGGGLYVTSSELEIRECIIRNNWAFGSVAPGYGGGVYCEGSTLTVLSSELRSNAASGDAFGLNSGGALHARSSTVVLRDSDVVANGGGGVVTRDSLLTIEDSVLSNNSGRCIAFTGQPDVLIEGNTISGNSNGGYVTGAGISGSDFGHVTIRDNEIFGNINEEHAGDFLHRADGGGIYLSQGDDCLIENNAVTDNVAESSKGGSSTACGGGLCVSVTNATIRGNDISRNRATAKNSQSSMTSRGGGALVQTTGLLIFENNQLFDNMCEASVTQAGGGAHLTAGTTGRIVDNTFSRNHLVNDSGSSIGAGVYVFGADVQMIGNQVTANTLPDLPNASQGGGVWVGGTAFTSINDTFADNAVGPVAGLGGGLYLNGVTAVLENAIVWGNSPDQIHVAAGSATVTFSDVQGGFPGTGNINSDPLFIDAPNGDYRLSCASPCIDAGTNSTSQPLPAFDVSGLDRRQIGPFVDMGADEAGVFWSFNGPAIAGGPPVDFTLTAAPGHPSPAISEVFLSFGDGTGTGLPVPLSSGRRIGLSADSLLSFWLSLPTPVRQVSPNGCAGATTASVSLPASAPVGVTFYWAGIAWDLGAGTVTSITPTQSDVTQ